MKKLFIFVLLLTAVLNLRGELKMQVVEQPEIKVVGITSLISSEHNVIGTLWERFMPREQEIMHVEPKGVGLGVSYDMEEMEGEAYLFYHLVGLPVSKVGKLPEGMTYMNLPAGKYAKFTHKGSMAELQKTYAEIYGKIIPASDYMIDYKGKEYEWYDERFKMGEQDSEFDIFVPVIKK